MGGSWLSQVSGDRRFQKLSASSQNFDDFTHRALIRCNERGISGKRQLLMNTGGLAGLAKGQGLKGPPPPRPEASV